MYHASILIISLCKLKKSEKNQHENYDEELLPSLFEFINSSLLPWARSDFPIIQYWKTLLRHFFNP